MLRKTPPLLIQRTVRLSLLLAKAKKRMIFTKYNLSDKVELMQRVLRSVGFRDWQIFKTGNVLHTCTPLLTDV